MYRNNIAGHCARQRRLEAPPSGSARRTGSSGPHWRLEPDQGAPGAKEL